ncbi:flagellar biosynthetic protein FliO [Marispirochaeta sp.]|uniref:FliO/MopB family protein n=1 Tax=Marispirochaeta sp. TaxID=2038653 RepID=UPI0029C6752F|nr:flagellar biosynthetic protein FliO [Marispirochaeta sp.]
MKKNVLAFLLLAALVGSLTAQEAETETERSEVPITEESIIFGDTETSENNTTEALEPGGNLTIWSFVSMVLVLAGVVAAIYGLFFLLKRMAGRGYPDNDLIRILSTKSLSSTRSVHLISLGGRFLLVGSAENSVSLITEIDDKESRDEIDVFLAREDSSTKKSFKQLIGGLLSGGEESGDDSVSSSAHFLKNQGQRMKNL